MKSKPRMFLLHRADDETGISGTGFVAEGIQYSDGRVSMRWMTKSRSTVTWDSIEDVINVHGHGGRTKVVWMEDQ